MCIIYNIFIELLIILGENIACVLENALSESLCFSAFVFVRFIHRGNQDMCEDMVSSLNRGKEARRMQGGGEVSLYFMYFYIQIVTKETL